MLQNCYKLLQLNTNINKLTKKEGTKMNEKELAEKKLEKRLELFLRENRVLTEFKRMLRKNHHLKSLEIICKHMPAEDLIDNSFSWKGSKYDSKRWIELDNKWRNLCT